MVFLFFACVEPPELLVAPDCPLWYADIDGDGYGAELSAVSSCQALPGRVERAGDCDDRDRASYPGAWDEPLDGVDQDCDGEDTCARAHEVDASSPLRCGDGLLAVQGDLTDWFSWPEGDCVCSVSGDLNLTAEEAEMGASLLSQVGGDLYVGGNTDMSWSGQGLAGLEQVVGELRIYGGLDVNLSGLTRVGDLTLYLERDPANLPGPRQTVDLRSLETVSDRLGIIGSDVTLRLDKLSSVQRLSLNLNNLASPLLLTELQGLSSLSIGSRVDLPVYAPDIEQLDYFAVGWFGDTGPSLPALREVGSLLVSLIPGEQDEADVVIASIETAQTVNIRGGSVTFSDLETAGVVSTSFGGSLHAPMLVEADSLSVTGQSSFARLSSLRELGHSAESLYIPALESVELLESHSEAPLPFLRHVGEVQCDRATSLPGLRSAETVRCAYALEAPELVWVSHSLLLYAEDQPELTSLAGVNELNLEEAGCSAAPHLEVLLSPRVSIACDEVDLRGLTTVPTSPLQLKGSGVYLLPDPYPGSVWVDPRLTPGIHVDTIQGALVLWMATSDPPIDWTVKRVQGRLDVVAQDWTSVGDLDQLRIVEGDLEYCLPAMSTADLNAWIDSIDVWGEVIETCPRYW